MDECASNTTCQDNSTCINSIGSFSCVCADGYEYKNNKCQSILFNLKNFIHITISWIILHLVI